MSEIITTIPQPDLSLVDTNYEWINNISNPDLPKAIPALPTLYLENWAINLSALEEFIKKQSENWITAVLVAWTTWEASFMEKPEQIKYVEESVKIAKKFNIKVIAWAWANSTAEQNKLASLAIEAWASANLLLAPYYIKSDSRWIYKHLEQWLNKWPWIIYSISWRTWVSIPLEVIYKLSDHPNFIWVKECDWWERIKNLTNKWIRVWSWNDDELVEDTLKYWAYGSISVVCNLMPKTIQAIVEWSLDKKEILRLEQWSKILFPKNTPNPIAIHNASEMIRYKWEKIWFREWSVPFIIEQQEWMKSNLERLWIESNMFLNNYKHYLWNIEEFKKEYRIPKFKEDKTPLSQKW